MFLPNVLYQFLHPGAVHADQNHFTDLLAVIGIVGCSLLAHDRPAGKKPHPVWHWQSLPQPGASITASAVTAAESILFQLRRRKLPISLPCRAFRAVGDLRYLRGLRSASFLLVPAISYPRRRLALSPRCVAVSRLTLMTPSSPISRMDVSTAAEACDRHVSSLLVTSGVTQPSVVHDGFASSCAIARVLGRLLRVVKVGRKLHVVCVTVSFQVGFGALLSTCRIIATPWRVTSSCATTQHRPDEPPCRAPSSFRRSPRHSRAQRLIEKTFSGW